VAGALRGGAGELDGAVRELGGLLAEPYVRENPAALNELRQQMIMLLVSRAGVRARRGAV